MLPKNWPQEFTYISHAIPADFHPIFLRQLLSTRYCDDQQEIVSALDSHSVHPNIEIRVITKDLEHLKGRSHVLANTYALKGHFSRGVFATGEIHPNEVIGEYAGLVFYSNEGKTDPEWLTEYTWKIRVGPVLFAIKADQMANEMAFINDFSNIAPEPNVEMRGVIHRGSLHFCYVACKKIQSGEELLTSYNKILNI